MRIGEVAAATGVSTRALRYYEEQGLLSSGRSRGGQRCYPEAAVEQVRWIQALYRAGLSSSAIAGMGSCAGPGVASAEALARMRAELDALDVRIDVLTSTRHRLHDLVQAAEAGPVHVDAVQGAAGPRRGQVVAGWSRTPPG